jgi:hypothetical protein
VQVLEREQHLGGVEPRGVEREAAARHPVAQRVEVPAGAELHDHARQVEAGVEVGEHGGQERVVQAPQHALLRRRAAQLALPRQRAPVHHLHRVLARPDGGGLEAAQVHRADVPGPDAAEEREVPRAHHRGPAADGRPRHVARAVRTRWGGRGRRGRRRVHRERRRPVRHTAAAAARGADAAGSVRIGMLEHRAGAVRKLGRQGAGGGGGVCGGGWGSRH